MIRALVLAAGRGTRLGELTSERPKPLLPIASEPLLAYTLAHLARQGIADVAINVCYLGDQIRAAIGDGARFGLRIHYEVEPALLGTAGSVANLAGFFSGSDALVVYGDLLTDQPLGPLIARHREAAADATLLVHRRRRSNSAVELDGDGRVVCFRERPGDTGRGERWVNSGFQLLAPSLIAALARRPAPLDLPADVYAPGCAELRLFGVPLSGYRCAIDSPERYRQAQDAVATGSVDIVVPPA